MSAQDLLHRLLHLLRLAHKVLALAALGLARIGRQLHPVDGEHLATDQALTIADQQYLREYSAHRIAQAAYERSQRAVVRLAVPAQCHEQHDVAACPLPYPASSRSHGRRPATRS